MSLGLNKTKRRIASIQSTQKITKAMGMVATVKLRRYLSLTQAAQTFADKYREIMAELFLHDEESRTHYALENEEAEGTLYIVITSSLGLCAGYNANVFKFVESIVDPAKDIVAPIGTKGRSHFTNEPEFAHVDSDLSDVDKAMDPKQINALCATIKAAFNERKVRKIALIYTHYVNSMTFEPQVEILLPVRAEASPRPEEDFCPPLFEPRAREQIHVLLPYYLGAVLNHRLAESQLCEQASRRNAMDNANDNADELLRKLTIEYNKARQSAITQEIVEVVSGSANAK